MPALSSRVIQLNSTWEKKTELHKKGVGHILLDLCEYKCDFDGEGCDAVEKASEEKKCDKEGKSTKTRRHKINVLL
jgi:hypothetical protein